MTKMFRDVSERTALIDLLGGLADATKPAECFQAFNRAIATVGFDGAMFALRDESENWRENITETTYPTAWVAHYVARNYTKTDPVRRFCFRVGDVFFWTETHRFFRKKELVIFEEAREFGLRSGLATPIFSGGALVGAIGLGSEARRLEDPRLKPFVRMASSLFHAAYTRHGAAEPPVENPIPLLTKREMEILGLMSEGNANAKISAELSIGLGSVEYHVANIFKKLAVDNRVAAVVRAIRLGLIDV